MIILNKKANNKNLIYWEKMSIKYNIFFRACDKVESVHKDKRPFGLNKLETIKVSWLELL
jgi:hypothetical protein